MPRRYLIGSAVPISHLKLFPGKAVGLPTQRTAAIPEAPGACLLLRHARIATVTEQTRLGAEPAVAGRTPRLRARAGGVGSTRVSAGPSRSPICRFVHSFVTAISTRSPPASAHPSHRRDTAAPRPSPPPCRSPSPPRCPAPCPDQAHALAGPPSASQPAAAPEAVFVYVAVPEKYFTPAVRTLSPRGQRAPSTRSAGAPQLAGNVRLHGPVKSRQACYPPASSHCRSGTYSRMPEDHKHRLALRKIKRHHGKTRLGRIRRRLNPRLPISRCAGPSAIGLRCDSAAAWSSPHPSAATPHVFPPATRNRASRCTGASAWFATK